MYDLRLSARKGKVRISVNVANLNDVANQLERRGYVVDGAQLHKANDDVGKRFIRRIKREFS